MRPWIDLRATLCILDPRQLLDERAVSNDNFRDQLAAADIIVANKSDRETAESARALADWWQRWGGERRKVSAIQGNIDLTLLDEPRRNTAPAAGERGARPPPSPPTSGLAALSLAEHQRWRRHLQQWPGLSGLRLDLRRGDGFLTPSACSNGSGWRQWGALKA